MASPRTRSARPSVRQWTSSNCPAETCRFESSWIVTSMSRTARFLINRIKPHTDFHGRYESGLMKMALIGLGKLEGARAVHDFGIYGLRELIAPGAAQVLSTGKILAGIGLVENAFHETLHVEVLKADADRARRAAAAGSREAQHAASCRWTTSTCSSSIAWARTSAASASIPTSPAASALAASAIRRRRVSAP